MEPLLAGRVAETLGIAAAATRKVLGHAETAAGNDAFAELSSGLRLLEEQRSTAAAQACVARFEAVRAEISSTHPEVAAALAEAVTALTALAARAPTP